MTLEYKRSLTELNSILNYMNVEHIKKIPAKFIDFINKNMDKDYIPNIDKNVPINQQELKKDTKVLLSLIYRNYWCDNETKENLLHQDIIVKKNFEQEMLEKYNPDNIFKNKQKIIQEETTISENVQLVEYKQSSWYKNKLLEEAALKLYKEWFVKLFRKDCD